MNDCDCCENDVPADGGQCTQCGRWCCQECWSSAWARCTGCAIIAEESVVERYGRTVTIEMLAARERG